MFVPASLNVRRGHHGAVGQRRAQHAQRHARAPAARVREREPEAGQVVRAHVRGRGHVRVLLHAARRRRRAASTPSSGSATPRPPPRCRRWAAERHAPPTFEASGRTIRVPGRRQDDPGGRRPRQAGRPRARVAGRVPGERRPSPPTASCSAASTGTARSSTASSSVRTVCSSSGADGVAVENLTTRNYTENGFFWSGVLGYRGLVPHRVPQRRLRHLRVRLAVRAVRPLVRVGQPRLRLLHRAVQPVSRGHHRRRVRVQPARLLGHELVGRPLHRELGVVAATGPASCPTASTAKSWRRRALATIAGNVVDANGDDRRRTIGGRGLRRRARRRHRDRRAGSANTITKNRVVDNAKVGIALAPSVGLQAVPTSATGNQVTDNVVQGSGLADLAVILPTRRRSATASRPTVHDVGAGRTSNG